MKEKTILNNKYIIYEDGNIEKTDGGIIRFYLMNGYSAFSYKGKTYYVHRIIAENFIPNYEELPCVNHKDGNKLNNNVNNLEWCTYSYNSKEAYRLGLKHSNKNTKTKKHKRVVALNDKDETIFILNKINYIDLLFKGKNSGNIIRAIKNGTMCKGFYWKYLD